MTIAQGWYPDPSNPNQSRWWDGTQWTKYVHPIGRNAAPKPSERVLSKREARERVKHLESVIAEHGLHPAAEAHERFLGYSRELDSRKHRLERELAALERRLGQLKEEIAQHSAELVEIRDSAALQELGLFDREHPAESSAVLAGELEVLRTRIKSVVRDGRATTATADFTYNNSAAKGRTFVANMSKILLRAYNAEAENAVTMMRAGRLESAQKRLARVADQIARQGNMIQLEISPEYQSLRMYELELADRHLRAKQRERDLERERKAELREQRQAERELAAEHARLDKEKSHYLSTLAALEAQGDEEGMSRMRERIEDVEKAIADVDYRAANIRAGYVYVISNIGSFGPEVIKIGMTRRLTPMDRVTELGDASVPFRFDVHALFFSDDAVGLEARLHKHFEDKRVNKVNLRREYFYATPTEVLTALRAWNVEVVEFKTVADAPEFRLSSSRNKEGGPAPGPNPVDV